MSLLTERHIELGANIANDGIPLDYGDLKREYHAIDNGAILLDRSHEGRLILEGKDRYELIQRISTNDVLNMKDGTGRGTIFTNSNARILFRLEIYADGEKALGLVGPGQGQFVTQNLQRQIFFRDEVKLNHITPTTHQFAIHGINSNKIMQHFINDATDTPPFTLHRIVIANHMAQVLKRTSLVGGHWTIICQQEDAVDVYNALLEIGQVDGLIPAGSLTYNTLRIRSGQLAGRELSQDYIPLEIGLWNEIDFHKGCYTGQEIIARMDSREKLAKTIVSLSLKDAVQAPSTITSDGVKIGTLTSAVQAPDGQIFGIGVIKSDYSRQNTAVFINENIEAIVTDLIGTPPPYLVKLWENS